MTPGRPPAEGHDNLRLMHEVLEVLEQNPEWVAGREADARRLEQKHWFDNATDEQVIDRVYGSYQQARENLGHFVDGMSEAEKSRWLKSPRTESTTLLPHVEGAIGEGMGDYPGISKLAFDRFYRAGLRNGDFTQALALVTELKDPELAREFLRQLNTPRDDRSREFASVWEAEAEEGETVPNWVKELTRDVDVAVSEHVQRERLVRLRGRLGRSSLLRAIGIGATIRRPRSLRKLTETMVYKPLREVAALPPLQLQIIQQALQSSPLDKAR